jgi:hypothetical protein
MAFNLENGIRYLERLGVLDVALPLLLFFAVLYAVLQKTKVLGDGSKKAEYEGETDPKKKATLYAVYAGTRFNGIVAFVIALLAVIPHVIYGGPKGDGRMSLPGTGLVPNPVEIVNNSLPSVGIIVVAILMIFLLMGILGTDTSWFGNTWVSGTIAFFALLIIVYIFGTAANLWRMPVWLRNAGFANPNNIFGFLILLAFFVGLYFVIREPSP